MLIYGKKAFTSELKKQQVWMSHGDSIQSLPPQAIASYLRIPKDLITAFSMENLLSLSVSSGSKSYVKKAMSF